MVDVKNLWQPLPLIIVSRRIATIARTILPKYIMYYLCHGQYSSLAQACGWTLCRYASQPALVANSLRFVIKTRGGFHNTNLSKLSFSHVLICAGLSRFAMRADAPMMWTIFEEVPIKFSIPNITNLL